jgi:Holliday junction resolvase RusA-like endonuclease
MSFDPHEGWDLQLPFVPVSKKNRTRIKRGRGGKSYIAKGDEVKAQEAEIQWLVMRSLRELEERELLFGKQAALRAELIWLPRLEQTHLHVRQVGQLQTRPKRDAANLPALVLDALQGLIYADDRQVVEVEVVTDLAS